MGYAILKADLEKESNKIIDFWRYNFPTWPDEKFIWFYQKNIYGPADCWLIKETKSDAIIGSAAIFPRRVYCQGKSLLAGISGDFAVDKRHRVLGPAVQLQRALAEFSRTGKYDFVYGYPNTRSEPVQKHVGFKILGSTTRLVRVLRTEKYLAKSIPNTFFAGTVGKLANVGMSLCCRESRQRLNSNYQMALLDQIDERFDLLWNKAKSNFHLIGERNNAFLTWRFVKCPFRKYEIFTLNRKNDGSLIGYVIFYCDEGSIHIADVLAENPYNLKDLLLPAFLKFTRKGKYDSISILFLGQKLLFDALKKYHFVSRESDRNLVVLSGRDGNLPGSVTKSEQWYFLEADND